MSWRHGLAAGELPLRDPTAKAVLNALAFHANDFTGHGWPDIERLMLFTGLSERAVQMGIKRLEAAKLVKVKRGTGRGRASEYWLLLPGVRPLDMAKKKGAPPAAKGAPPAGKGAPDAPQSSGRVKEQTRALTEDWKPDQETMAWARAQLPNGDVDIELARFIAVNLAKPEEEVRNVRQAFRAWILRGVQLEGSRAAEARRRSSSGSANGRLRAIAGGKAAGS